MFDETPELDHVTPADRDLLAKYTPQVLADLRKNIIGARVVHYPEKIAVCHSNVRCEGLGSARPGALPPDDLPWGPCVWCPGRTGLDELFAVADDALRSIGDVEALGKVPDLLTGAVNDLDAAAAILGNVTRRTRVAGWSPDLPRETFEEVYNEVVQLREQFRAKWTGLHFPQVGTNAVDDVYVWCGSSLSLLHQRPQDMVLRDLALAYGLDLPAGTPAHRWADSGWTVTALSASGSVGTLLRIPRAVRQSGQSWLRALWGRKLLCDLGPAVDRREEPALVDLFNQWLDAQTYPDGQVPVWDVMEAARAAVQPVPVS